jgi:hypothetical protein
MENHERREEWYWVKLCTPRSRGLSVPADILG